MDVQQWSIVIGVVVSAAVALTPWMLMVHAKLAVLGSLLASLERKVDRLIEANDQRLPMCARHAALLETHEVQLADVCDRLRQME